MSEIVKRTGYFSDEDFLVAIAEGALTAPGILAKIKEEPALRREFALLPEEEEELTPDIKAFDEKQSTNKSVYIKGAPDVLVRADLSLL